MMESHKDILLDSFWIPFGFLSGPSYVLLLRLLLLLVVLLEVLLEPQKQHFPQLTKHWKRNKNKET